MTTEQTDNVQQQIPVEINNVVESEKKPTPNVIQESEIFSPITNKDEEDGIVISFPSDTQENIEKAIDEMPNVDIEETQDGADWVNRVRAARYSIPHKNWFLRTVGRQESAYRQYVESEKGKLAAGGLKFNDAINGKLTGERAVLRVRALTGLGSTIMVPLWHSGFWLTLKAPTEGAMLELNRRLSEEKIQLGRSTYGLAYANNSVFFAGWLVDFALNHVYDTSLKPEVSVDIRTHISQYDVPIIIWGLACTIWPNGFPYARAVMNQTTEQNKVIKEKVNLGKLLWPDTASLTPWQVSHMAQRHGSTMTKESLERYRSEFTRGKGRAIKLTENITVMLRTPSLDQYLTSGQKWVNGIVNMVDKAFGMNPNEGMRDSYIMDQGKATNMRQYSHFVESLEVAGDTIDDVDTVEQTFDALSSSDSIRDAFFNGVKEFIEDSTIAIVAIPVTEDEDRSELPRFPRLLPLDVMSVFFILLTGKVMQVQSRA